MPIAMSSQQTVQLHKGKHTAAQGNQTTRRRPSTPHGVAVTHHPRAGDAGRRGPWSPLFVPQPSPNGRCAQAVSKTAGKRANMLR